MTPIARAESLGQSVTTRIRTRNDHKRCATVVLRFGESNPYPVWIGKHVKRFAAHRDHGRLYSHRHFADDAVKNGTRDLGGRQLVHGLQLHTPPSLRYSMGWFRWAACSIPYFIPELIPRS